MLKLIIVKDSEAVNLAKLVLEMAKTEAQFQRQFKLIQAILKSKFPKLTIEEIVAMFDLKTAIISDEPDSYEEFVKIFEKRGESAILIRQLKRRCGVLSMDLEKQVRSLSIPELESLGEALLDFQSIIDLETWLKQSGHSFEMGQHSEP